MSEPVLLLRALLMLRSRSVNDRTVPFPTGAIEAHDPVRPIFCFFDAAR